MAQSRIIDPLRPVARPFTASMKVACIGSCFAHEISESLKRTGKETIPVFLSERVNTPFALAYAFANAFCGAPYPDGYLIEPVTDAAGTGLDRAEAFIITLGLSLCWFDRATGKMVSAPRKAYSESGLQGALEQYELRQTSVSENVAQVASVVETIRAQKPAAPIVLTLSPVPLLTVTSGSPVAGNTVSKSTLRVALHEIMARNLENVFYWPSYELVEWYGKYVSILWGRGDNDMRHLPAEFIDAITRLFVEAYYQVEPPVGG